MPCPQPRAAIVGGRTSGKTVLQLQHQAAGAALQINPLQVRGARIEALDVLIN